MRRVLATAIASIGVSILALNLYIFLLSSRRTASMRAAITFEVFGRVQGVWFRKYTQREARRLSLVGWVRNTSRGTVEGVAHGTPSDLQEFQRWLCEIGSPQSRIDNCVITEEETTTTEPIVDDFRVVGDG